MHSENKKCRAYVISTQLRYSLHSDILYHVSSEEGRGFKRGPYIGTSCYTKETCSNYSSWKPRLSFIRQSLWYKQNNVQNQVEVFWPGMYSDIVNYVTSCDVCSQRKDPPRPITAQVVPMPVADGPWQRVSTYIFGPLPTCKDTGNKYILVLLIISQNMWNWFHWQILAPTQLLKLSLQMLHYVMALPNFCTQR